MKGELYTNLAAELIQFNGSKTREISFADAGKAIDYVLKAIHINSKYNDVFAIRNNYDCLASAYFIQKKYAQAKWFILQSSHISRFSKDNAAIINSLMRLASVKIVIKDYKMAERDFNEAIALTIRTNEFARRIEIEKCLATLYSISAQKKLEVITEKRFTLLEANLDKNLALFAKQKLLDQQKYMVMAKLKNPKKPVMLKRVNIPNLNIVEENHSAEVKPDIQATALDINTQD